MADYNFDDLERQKQEIDGQKALLNSIGSIGDALASKQSFGNFVTGRMNPESTMGARLAKNYGDAMGDPVEKAAKKMAFDKSGAELAKSRFDLAESQGESDPNSPKSVAFREALARSGQKVPEGASYKQLKAIYGDLAADLIKQRQGKLMDRETEMLKNNPAYMSEDQKLAKLSGDQKGRYDNIVMANRSINQMFDALKGGQSRYNMIGDNDYTAALGRFKEAVGRMQSGGAIGEKEAKQFVDLARAMGDDVGMSGKKLAELKQIMQDRYRTLGFDPSRNPEMAQGIDVAALMESRKSKQEGVAHADAMKPNKDDLEAFKWANANPKDPRSKGILLKLKQKGLF